MEHASKQKSIGIVGAGASGCICAYFLQKLQNKNISITLFDKTSPLRTLLPTGGGRCNLAHAEFDFKELAKNYPRGEKFLYSVFSIMVSNRFNKYYQRVEEVPADISYKIQKMPKRKKPTYIPNEILENSNRTNNKKKNKGTKKKKGKKHGKKR